MKQSHEAPVPAADQALTPPDGDELRSEVTFGRTDRYANVDDESADRTNVDGERADRAEDESNPA